MKQEITKKKISTISLISVLIISSIIIILPAVTAQDPGSKTTFALIGAIPNPIGINQQLLIHTGISDRLATSNLGWEGVTVEVTKPDGTTETLGPFKTDSTGGTGAIYVPTMVGTYTLQTHFPEQVNPAYVRPFLGPELPEGIIMEESFSELLEVIVQEEPIDFYPYQNLPTEYWNRPIDAQFREWSTIAGNWLQGYNLVPPNLIAPFNDGPETPHVLWAKPLVTGGLAGGATGNHAFDCGDAYEGFYLGAVILAGNLYYNNYKGFNPTQEVVAVNLHTGEELWRKPLLTPEGSNLRLAFAQNFYWDSYNYHAVFPYLWATRGSTWHSFDPYNGEWVFTMENVSSGTNIYGPKGEIFRYTVNLNAGWMTLWNSSRVGSTQGSWGSQVTGRTLDGANGIEWNITIPDNLPGRVRAVLNDRIIGAEITSTIVNSWGISVEPGDEGTIIFQNSWQAPAEWEHGRVFVDWAAISGEDNVFVLWARESREYFAFSTETGELLWGPSEAEDYLNIYKVTLEKYGESKIAYGKLFSTAMSGIVYCYDVTSGELEWSYDANDPFNEILWANSWPVISLFITDGKIYIGHEEHSPIDPKPRGAPFFCLDVETGEEVYRVDGLIRQNHWGGRALIGDSIIATMDSYDQRIYAIGKGPTEITIEAPSIASDWGDKIVLRGRVNDISPGTQAPDIKMRFPKGVPAVSDGDMGAWMKYVYKQFDMPMVSGVPVKLEVVVDPNYNWYDIGIAYTDASGFYAIEWEPPVPGQYWILATFEGSKSYYSTYVETSVVVNEGLRLGSEMEFEQPTILQELTVPKESAEAPLISTDITIIIAVIAISIIGIGTSWYLRKK